MKLKITFVAMSAFVFAACQPTAPTSNVQNTQPLPTIAVQTAPIISSAENTNASNASDGNTKSNQTKINLSPTASPVPKKTVLPPVESKYKNYLANGIVKAIDVEKNSIVIDHEDIGDYMVAMEMPFPVVSKDLLKNVKIGDKIEFVLQTGVGVERIVHIRKK